MTGSQEEFEDRLRRVLDQAAGQLPVPPVAWRGPSPGSDRRRLPRPRLDPRLPGDSHERAARLRRWPTTGALLTGLTAIVSIAVAVGAIALLSHHRGQQQSSAAPAQALISKLAVLRRPQTPADVLPAHLHLADPNGVIIPSLTRLVAVLPGAKLFLVVTTPAGRSPPFWSPKLGDQVAIVAVTAQGSTESVAIPAADLTSADELMQAGVTGQRRVELRDAYDVAIVPDGVARVRWTFANDSYNPGRVVNTQVTNNVAVVRLERSTGMLLRATWYGADGSVIPTSDRAQRSAIAARQAVMRARDLRQDARYAYRAAPALLADFAVFAVNSRSGVRTAAGNIISHPRLASLPLPILNITSPNQPPQLDPEDMRQVTTRSGARLWIIPGQRGLCVAELDPPRLPSGLSSGAGEGCSGTLAKAESHGAGLSSGRPGGLTTTYQVLPKTIPTITIRTSRGTRKTIHPPDGVYVGQTGASHR